MKIKKRKSAADVKRLQGWIKRYTWGNYNPYAISTIAHDGKGDWPAMDVLDLEAFFGHALSVHGVLPLLEALGMACTNKAVACQRIAMALGDRPLPEAFEGSTETTAPLWNEDAQFCLSAGKILQEAIDRILSEWPEEKLPMLADGRPDRNERRRARQLIGQYTKPS